MRRATRRHGPRDRGGRPPSRRRRSRKRGRDPARRSPLGRGAARGLRRAAVRRSRVRSRSPRRAPPASRRRPGRARTLRPGRWTPGRRPARRGRRPRRRRAPRSGSRRRSRRGVARRRGCRDDERNPVGVRCEGQPVRPDLVRHVAVRRDAVRADDDRVDAPARDEGGRGDVREKRDTQAVLRELPGRQARALQERPRLVREDRDRPRGRKGTHDAEGRADPRGREGARVAVRQDGRDRRGEVRVQPRGAEAPDLEAGRAVLLGDPVRLGLEKAARALRPRRPPFAEDSAHPRDGSGAGSRRSGAPWRADPPRPRGPRRGPRARARRRGGPRRTARRPPRRR